MSKARKSGRVRSALREKERLAQREALKKAPPARADSGSSPKRVGPGLLRVLAASLLVVLVLAAALIFTGGGRHSKPSKRPSPQESETVSAVSELLAGIPQHADVLGDPQAPATLEYFADLECLACRQFTLTALPEVIERWVRDGELKIEYRAVQTATKEPKVFLSQQIAALSAGEQNLLWNYIELFYHEQGEEGSNYVTPSYLQNLARQVPGLNYSRWSTRVDTRAFIDQLEGNRKFAEKDSLTRAPSFMLGLTGGTMKELLTRSIAEPRGFDEAIEQLLKNR